MLDVLSKLTRVSAGKDLLDVLTAERINAIQDAIKALAGGDNLAQGANTQIKKGKGLISISSNRQARQPNPISTAHFAFQSDGWDDIVGTIGQDPGKRSKRGGREDRYTDGGLHALNPFPGQPFTAPVIPADNQSGGNAIGYGYECKTLPLDVCNFLQPLSTTGRAIAKMRIDTFKKRAKNISAEDSFNSPNKYARSCIEFLEPGVYKIEMDSSTFMSHEDDEPSMNYPARTTVKWATVGGYRDEGDKSTPERTVAVMYETLNTTTRNLGDFQANVNFSFRLLNATNAPLQ